jgi:hypothetical protein
VLPANASNIFVTSPHQPENTLRGILVQAASKPGKKPFLASFYLELVFWEFRATWCFFPGKSQQTNIFAHILLFTVRFFLPKTQIVLNLRGHTSSGLSDFVRINP